eukprot:UN28289
MQLIKSENEQNTFFSPLRSQNKIKCKKFSCCKHCVYLVIPEVK